MCNNSKNRNLNFIEQVGNHMDKNELMLCYRGEVSQDILIALLNLAENNLNLAGSENSTKKRVFGVMIECLQNITQHSEKEEFRDSNMFMIGTTKDGYIINSGNVIRREKVQDLARQLHSIKNMNESKLKEFSTKLIQHESVSGDSGFGLGLVQIARKTGNSIEFAFEEVDEDHLFFTLRTLIDFNQS